MGLNKLQLKVFGRRKNSFFILDAFPSTGAAWSVNRLLRSDYSGALIRVRRSSDNTEMDINAVDGILDTATLLTFAGAGSAFVKTIYDQTTNGYNYTQATNSKQGTIVNTGSLITLNSKPAISFDGAGDCYSAGDVLSAPSAFTIISVEQNTNTGSQQSINKGLGQAGNREYGLSHIGLVVFDEDTVANENAGAYIVGSQYLRNAYYSDSLNILGYANNNSSYTTKATSITIKNYGANLTLFSTPSQAATYQGYWQEGVIWLTNESANKSIISSNINSFYNIF